MDRGEDMLVEGDRDSCEHKNTANSNLVSLSKSKIEKGVKNINDEKWGPCS